MFAGKLLLAADRGVRVRFLIDDIFTTGLDPELALLNSHPNIEIRLFNPISRQGVQLFNFLFDFQRANRRMHNKSFTVDNVVTIVGGRNIADEYFQIRSDIEFIDFDAIGIGPVAAMVSEAFDLFWNNDRAVPMEAIETSVGASDLNALRRTIMQQIELAEDGVYGRAVNSPYRGRASGRRGGALRITSRTPRRKWRARSPDAAYEGRNRRSASNFYRFL